MNNINTHSLSYSPNTAILIPSMKLVLALGNPEARYDQTRHNVGFGVLDAFAGEQGTDWQHKDKFKAYIAELTRGDEKILLAKPTTYYNLAGESARALADFYKITPEDILIIHDDLMLPFGTLRTRRGGRDAGNNGLKSLNAHLGETTARLRIGIWNDRRDRMDDTEFVLGKFSLDEQKSLAEMQSKTNQLIDAFITGSFETTTHR